MNQFVASHALPASGDESRGVVSPRNVPANPYEYFIAEKERLHRLLMNAGIDDDMAIETAIHVAMQKTTAKLNPDDYEFCNNVYGDAPMSMVICFDCNAPVDSDHDPECFVEVGNMRRLHQTITLCENCRGRREDQLEYEMSIAS